MTVTSVHNWLSAEYETLIDRLQSWCHINTHSLNPTGIHHFLDRVCDDYASLEADTTRLSLAEQSCIGLDGHPLTYSLGDILCFQKRPTAPKQVLLCIHSDTVYLPEDPFQTCTRLNTDTLQGPGVADAKGGLLVLLSGLLAYEKFCVSDDLGWTVLLVSDEEIGSMGSASHTQAYAKKSDLGLVFEPCLPNGNMISQRPGSFVWRLKGTGKSAHAGREFDKGINAITGLCRLIGEIDQIRPTLDGNCNIGVIQGGTAVNQVPESAVCELNFRGLSTESMIEAKRLLTQLVEEHNTKDAIQVSIHPYCDRPPKVFDDETATMYQRLHACAQDLSIDLDWTPSFGVSDANFMADAGLVTIDTLGPKGGNLHRSDEYVILPSIIERAELLCHFLQRFSAGD